MANIENDVTNGPTRFIDVTASTEAEAIEAASDHVGIFPHNDVSETDVAGFFIVTFDAGHFA